MMNIYEYFDNLIDEIGIDEAIEVEQEVYSWYKDEDPRFDEYIEQHNIELYEIFTMMNGEEEYAITLWTWDMRDD